MHPETDEAVSGGVVGVHFVHELVHGVVAAPNKRERFRFATADTVLLTGNKRVIIGERFAVSGIDGADVEGINGR